MKYFAKIDKNNIVEEVIQSETCPSEDCVETFFNIQGKNFACGGFTYDKEKENFISPKPYPSWRLDKNLEWQPPVELVENGILTLWNENKLPWEERKII